MSNTFFEVFSNIKVSDNLRGRLEDLVIKDIKYIKSESSLSLYLISEQFISTKYIKIIENKIKKYIKYIDDVKISINYNLNDNVENIILTSYKEIINDYEEDSPFVYKMLNSAKSDIYKDELKIHLNANSYFYLKEKNIDKEISDIYKTIFNKNINVILSKKENIIKYDEYEIKKEKELQRLDAVKPFEIKQTDTLESTENKENQKEKSSFKPKRRNGIKYNEDISRDTLSIVDSIIQDEIVCIQGDILETEVRELKSGRYLITFDIGDNTSAVTVKFFSEKDIFEEEFKQHIKKGKRLIIKGYVRFDEYAKELNIMANELCEIDKILDDTTDEEEVKRVELHLHTNMSSMDGVTDIKKYVEKAKQFGHKALAVTDHGVVQAFPNAMKAVKGTDIKII